MKASKTPIAVLATFAVTALCLASAQAASSTSGERELECKMKFDLSSWSVAYETASGTGTIRCSNNQSAKVKLEATGGGLTAGKYKIDNGTAEFSDVSDISDLYGAYASGTAHGGAVHSGAAQVITKGPVTAALSGTGEGWDLGISFSKFKIEPMSGAPMGSGR
jgi:hypothetical protein